MVIKKIDKNNILEFMALEKKVWHDEWQASEAAIMSRITIFPEGVIGIYENNALIATSTSMIIDYEINNSDNILGLEHSWDSITDSGFISIRTLRLGRFYMWFLLPQ